MQIHLNGSEQDCADLPLTVTDLLKQFKVDTTQIAVEKNFEIIPKSRYDEVMVESGDQIELVEFVGGG